MTMARRRLFMSMTTGLGCRMETIRTALGPATGMGFDAFATIGGGVNGVANPGTVIVYPGSYSDNVTTTKTLTIKGARFGVDARGRVAGAPIPRWKACGRRPLPAPERLS